MQNTKASYIKFYRGVDLYNPYAMMTAWKVPRGCGWPEEAEACLEGLCLRARSVTPFQARKTDFLAGKFWPVKNLIQPINPCSVRAGPIKILSISGLSSSPTARKHSSTSTL
jgi:hypothetical protein